MKTIITIQHTQSVHHTNAMVGSWTDWELSFLCLLFACLLPNQLALLQLLLCKIQQQIV